ncbi:hypothetical protein [Halalkalicoccus subterraneus]|uniref:hypothetical protein n=1 Tax=Halalkalicoccus subterraneus TaxID=2675002 RepID=UPI000EFC0793|nr:hypothetical protein [Halalkalicoccus subterraneus]
MADPIAILTDVQPQDRVQLTLLNGERIDGVAHPVDVEPERRLRIELRTGDEDHAIRYDVRSTTDDGDWATPTARRYDVKHDEGEWIVMGDVKEATVLEHASDREERSNEHL